MSQFIDKSEKNTLPEPDLNPLLNPLLAENMGRWAEVYFTSPPEKRAEAVAELVRLLQRESAGKVATPAAELRTYEREGDTNVRDQSKTPGTEAAPPLQPRQDTGETSFAAQSGVCIECGHTSPEDHLFCGMCGAALRLPEEGHFSEPAPLEPLSEVQAFGTPRESRSFEHETKSADYELADQEDEPINYGFAGEEHAAKYRPGGAPESYDTVFPPPLAAGEHEDSYVRPLSENDLPHFARQAEAVPYRYRLYLVLAIIIVLGALIYMARRGDVFSGSQQSPAAKSIPAQPTSSPTEVAPPQNPPPVEKIEKAESPAHPSATSAKAQEKPTNRNNQEPATTPPARRPQLRAAPSSPSVGTQSANAGAEELAEAQKYLNGSYGSSRNGAEAAQWLWKAVAKGNGSAALTLSDLYLHGNGITQNCDQARLLLDVAAKKGVKGAAERLRNLQAFGCK